MLHITVSMFVDVPCLFIFPFLFFVFALFCTCAAPQRSTHSSGPSQVANPPPRNWLSGLGSNPGMLYDNHASYCTTILLSHLGAEGHILTENTSLSRFSAGLHSKNHPVAVGGILVSGGLAAIFAKLEPARLRYPTRFAGKSQGYASVKSGRPASVH
jgi:hypothetical protein